MDEGKRNRNEEHKRWQLRSTVSLRALPSVSFIELQKSMDFFSSRSSTDKLKIFSNNYGEICCIERKGRKIDGETQTKGKRSRSPVRQQFLERRVIWEEGQVTIAFFLLSENVDHNRCPSSPCIVSIGIPGSK